MGRTTGRRAAAVALLAALALVACEEEPVSPGDPQADKRPPVQGEDKVWQHMYGTWLDVAKEVPGYAGDWKEDGATVIGLTDPATQEAKALAVFGSRQMSYDRTAASTARTTKTKYDVYDLVHWHNEAGSLIGEDNIWGVGLAFDENAISVRITPDADESVVKDRLKAIGVPLDGVVIRRSERPTSLNELPATAARQDTTYRLNSRAVSGGLRPGFQIEVNRSTSADASCTLGVVLNTTELGVMLGTNAHCTDYLDFVDDNRLHQPFVPATDSEVALEVWHSPRRTENDDGPPTQTKCDFSGGCMFADFALFELTNQSRHGRVGDIQRTTTGNPRDTRTLPDHYTTMERAWFQRLKIGDGVKAIGQTSGEVGGTVTDPCLSYDDHLDDPPQSIKWLCEVEVNASGDGGVARGDSGSPVIGSSDSSPVFLGIAHAGGANGMIFSPTMDLVPFRQYRQKIGAMKFCATCAWIDPE